ACNNDCIGGACAGTQCASHGTTLVRGLTAAAYVGVDDQKLYYVDATTKNAMFIDKNLGGTPQAFADHVQMIVVAGDGSVYMVRNAAWPATIERWSRATGTSATIATISSFGFDTAADRLGVTWCDTQGNQPNVTSTVYAWSPGDAAPRVLTTE